MNVICRHGFIKFFPDQPEQVIRFRRLTGISLVSEHDYFTFEALIGLPRYSIKGMPYAGLPAIKTYEGRDASEVFRENDLVYELESKTVIPTTAILNSIALSETLSYAVAPGPFIQPGARLQGAFGGRIVSYNAWLSLDYQRLYVFDREIK